MSTPQQLIAIRSRKLGVLIYDARTSNRRSVEECAAAMCVPTAQYETYEKGAKAPSLPELEALAYYLNIPLEHFWGSTTLEKKPGTGAQQAERLLKLRHRIIGTYLRLGRSKSNLSPKELSDKTFIPEAQIKSYELGELPVPLPELELLSNALNMRIEEFYDQSGPVGKLRSDQLAMQKFLELSPELQQFVVKPVNHPYLELAMRLSELPVERLRAIAESLLEITY